MLALCIEKKKSNASLLLFLCESSKFIAVASYNFKSAAALSELRMRCFSVDSKIKVVKNSLARIALMGSKYESLVSNIKGPTVFIFSTLNIVKILNLLKNIVEFRKFFFEDRIFDYKFIKFFLTLPSVNTLFFMFFNILKSLLVKFVMVLKCIYIRFIKVLCVVKNIRLKGV